MFVTTTNRKFLMIIVKCIYSFPSYLTDVLTGHYLQYNATINIIEICNTMKPYTSASNIQGIEFETY